MQPNDTRVIHKLPKRVYLEYIKLFPITKTPEIKTYTTLILTLAAIIIFSVFAISPTLKTIIGLRKTLADSRFANESLETKITAMQSLQTQYGNLGSTLDRVDAAIPTAPEVSLLLAKVQTLIRESGLRQTKLESREVALTKEGMNREQAASSSFVFTVTVNGNYEQLTRFLHAIHTFDRIVTIDSLTISRDIQSPDTLTIAIRARAYFHPEASVEPKEVTL